MLDKVKLALRITDSDFYEELNALIASARADLAVAGVTGTDSDTDPLIQTAVISYCKMHFGEPDEYDRLKASYDEQKAQLSTHTGHTEWGL